MSSITVTPNLQTKSVSSSTSAQTVTPDNGYCRLRQVNISAFSGNIVTTFVSTLFVRDLTYFYSSRAPFPHIYSYSRNVDGVPIAEFLKVFSRLNFTGQDSNYVYII